MTDRHTGPADREDDRNGGEHRSSASPESGYAIYECAECDNIILSIGDEGPAITCHDERMDRVTDWDIDVQSPDLREVLLDAFGLPKAGIDICLCVIDEGPLAPSEIAEALGYNRSTVSEYLGDLVEIGLLQRTRLNREDGGHVNVYHSIDLETMRRETLIAFYAWAGEAASLIEDANLQKQEYMDTENEGSLQSVFWEEFREE